jgi:hypothetical protein
MAVKELSVALDDEVADPAKQAASRAAGVQRVESEELFRLMVRSDQS